jgi:hypothetical protein
MHGGYPLGLLQLGRGGRRSELQLGKTEGQKEGQREEVVVLMTSAARCSGRQQPSVGFYRPEEGAVGRNSPSTAALQRASACERRLLAAMVALRRWSVQGE